MHLVYLIHGLFGKKSHMESMREVLEETLPRDEYLIHIAGSNELVKTFEGVKIGGMRLYIELLELIENHPEVTHISIVGYSMGGLFARYLVGLLYEATFFEKIVPVNFATFSTPHLGTTLWKPDLETKSLNVAGRILLGLSGFHLMSRGPGSILDKMTEPDSCYMEGLRQFEHLMLFCNAVGDRSVRFWTSFITDRLPFSRGHKSELDLVFYTKKSSKGKSAFVDLSRTHYNAHPNDRPQNKTSTSMSTLFRVLVGPVCFAMLCLSIYSCVKVVAVTPYYEIKKSLLTRKWKANPNKTFLLERARHVSDSVSIERSTHDNDPSSEGIGREYLPEGVYGIAEEIAPPDSDVESDPVSSGSESTGTDQKGNKGRWPQPSRGTTFVDLSPRKIEFNSGMALRNERLNSLPWDKFVVYLHHFRTHAGIIDRLHEGFDQGREVLQVFADQVKTGGVKYT